MKRTFSSPPLTDSTGPIPCHHLPRPSSHLIVATSSGRGPSPTGGPLAYGLRRRLIARLVPPLSLAEPTVFLPISCCLRFYFPPSAPMSVCPAAVWSRTVGGTRYVYIQPPQLVLHPRRREIDTVECRSKRKRKNQSKIPFDTKTADGSRRAKVKTEVLLCRFVHTERRIDPRHWIATCQTKGFLTTPPCVCQSVSVSIK